MTEIPDPGEPEDPGPLWVEMDSKPRTSFAQLTRAQIPTNPGVYAVYRNGSRVYVGKAGELRSRVCRHNGKGLGMRGSAFRRNVAQYLGIADANAIYTQAHRVTAAEAAAVRSWIEACDIAWVERPTKPEAEDLERLIKLEYKPR